MTLPTNGITAEVIRDIMPPYQLNTDLLAATLAAVPPPPSHATSAWRQARVARLVQELAGLMPADAPQARIAAEIVIAREAVENSLARANAPGLTVDQVCRLRRTASALLASVATLERSLVRHQQKPVPFFGTVLADGVDVAALAAGWGRAGSRRDGEAASGAGGDAPDDGAVTVGMVGSATGASARGPGLSAIIGGQGADVAMEADPDFTMGLAPGVPVRMMRRHGGKLESAKSCKDPMERGTVVGLGW